MTGFNSKRAMARDRLQGNDMSAIKDLAYDIEQLYIEGHSAKMIATILDCPIEQVLGFLQDIGVADQPQEEEYSPYNGA